MSESLFLTIMLFYLIQYHSEKRELNLEKKYLDTDLKIAESKDPQNLNLNLNLNFNLNFGIHLNGHDS